VPGRTDGRGIELSWDEGRFEARYRLDRVLVGTIVAMTIASSITIVASELYADTGAAARRSRTIASRGRDRRAMRGSGGDRGAHRGRVVLAGALALFACAGVGLALPTIRPGIAALLLLSPMPYWSVIRYVAARR
jgi:hypothetical protein